jgi:hypothetical protein
MDHPFTAGTATSATYLFAIMVENLLQREQCQDGKPLYPSYILDKITVMIEGLKQMHQRRKKMDANLEDGTFDMYQEMFSWLQRRREHIAPKIREADSMEAIIQLLVQDLYRFLKNTTVTHAPDQGENRMPEVIERLCPFLRPEGDPLYASLLKRQGGIQGRAQLAAKTLKSSDASQDCGAGSSAAVKSASAVDLPAVAAVSLQREHRKHERVALPFDTPTDQIDPILSFIPRILQACCPLSGVRCMRRLCSADCRRLPRSSRASRRRTSTTTR